MNNTPDSNGMAIRTGRVIRFTGKTGLVEDAEELVVCQMRRQKTIPVCGDLVDWAPIDAQGVISKVHKRRNAFARADRHGRKRWVAANLDGICIVVAPHPEPTRDLLNRYLVACENLSIEPIIVCNKMDLAADMEHWVALRERYQALGYAVAFTEATGGNATQFEQQLTQGVHILVGQSGVGKTALLNQLIPDLDLQTGRVSEATGKGTHTTTATTLYKRPAGGALIDSPGVWEFGIWKMSPEEVAHGFREFRQLLGQCRFHNCQHLHEPDCAVAAAADAGQIETERLASYRRIVGALE
ncbi:MAG: putative ribosome biogenesis GTPase RsgA [Lysobacteraceae bacterium]|nr:MAG: putative ribosome biogenesis GTPase RsgA [Xanthomonadaceae bacterium]